MFHRRYQREHPQEMEQARLAYLPVRLYEVRVQAMARAVEALDE